MTRTHSLTTAALAVSLLGFGLTAASAQTFTVNGSVSGSAPTFTYSYLVTPTTGTLGLISFNFSDTNVIPGVAPTGFVAGTSVPTAGIYQFLATTSGGATSATTFTFTSADGIGGTLGATNISIAPGSAGVALVSGITPAPAPEPSQTAAFGLGLLGLSAMVLTARKRSAGSAA
jgi:hypothetical protein